jgi:MoxR-like ATPase
MLDKILALKAGTRLPLDEGDNFRAAVHVWSEPEINALKLALAARRPLLLRGEPGCGKSQLARAAAQVMGVGQPLVEVIHARFEPSDLLYRFDAMTRLLDAQMGKDGGLDPSNRKYLEPGVLWKAFDASRKGQQCSVVLIDEVDKADADLPNSLLDVLANRSFMVPMLNIGGRKGRVVADAKFSPLVIFTTNEERELPAAFVRRCMVLNLNPPSDPAALRTWLLERALAHAERRQVVGRDAVERAVNQTLADRVLLADQGFPKVGLAEVVDLLDALAELTRDLPAGERNQRQIDLLDELGAYGLVKYPVADPGQARVPIEREPGRTGP